ncbi:class I SAM-dependent methyltransferase [Nocardia blacklockiae]|uniref:class I SAM-dependent methyltransferase n=1 Tax=Nocardia blacklockiae TaxID=480036 RepID=UPI00189370A6|nr:class I SAM-dependent methyltransferase [Nocardia blacklockiae]MBF6172323.1 class I SAM-dependent methyltransferase [Nocardia blacklockiae]
MSDGGSEERVLGDEPVTSAYARNADYWIDIVRNRLDPFQTRLTDPALLESLGDCRDLTILDAGCGEGYLTRELVRRGAAHVHGVDTGAEFIAAARAHPEHRPERATFREADVAALPLPDNSIDVVVANRLPNGIAEPQRRFEEFARVLRPSGRLLLLGMHPCFYVARAERRSGGSGLAAADYFGGRTVEQRFDVAGKQSPAASVQRLYSLEAYTGMITAAGFAITRLLEPHPTDEQRRRDAWWDENFARPLFLLLECVPYRR